MPTLILAGTFPSPYGVAVPVMRDPSATNGDDLRFSMDATAICAGIYDPEQRRRFAEHATATRRVDVGQFGGGPVLKVPLPRPARPVNEAMRAELAGLPLEDWTTRLLDLHRWCDRADAILRMIGDTLEQPGIIGIEPIMVVGCQIVLTAALEHLPETEIDCLEAAAFYAVTMHQEWTEAAWAWLGPVTQTWFRDWWTARPRYAAFVKALDEPFS